MTDDPGPVIDPPPPKAGIGVVVIGRNEGDRLAQCLQSIDRSHPTVYVDSGSRDGSPDRARQMGIDVVILDAANGYTAARARNAGLDHLRKSAPDILYVQMIDGDCTLSPDWLATAATAMDRKPSTGALFGRRREFHPDRSIYNWLCDVEWAIPPGSVPAFGGDVMLRMEAVSAAHGYRDGMIAGEDPDLSIRLRQVGWEICCIDADMTIHDAALARFSQWWRRTARAGHAFAELAHRHPDRALHDYHGSCRRILFWGGAVPIFALTGLIAGLMTGARSGLAIFAAMLLLIAGQVLRLTIREMRHRPLRQALALAAFLTLGKYPEMLGMALYHGNRLRQRRSTLIEYKKRAA
jgi:GT2 family glycosyltransferase